MAARSTSQGIRYQRPRPFALPTIEQVQAQPVGILALFGLGPVTLLPREGLDYSAKVMEEIMKIITDENVLRNNARPEWRKYVRDSSDPTKYAAETFTNPNVNGTNLAGQPVEIFPLMVQQIQEEIEKLVEATDVPDSMAALFARIFANNTTPANRGVEWQDFNKLPSAVTLHGGDAGSTKVFTPLANAQAGDWPFSVSDLSEMVPAFGVSPIDPQGGNNLADVSTSAEAGKIETSDPNFPQSPYGAVTPSGVPGTKGIRMTGSNITVWNRTNQSNSSLGVGAGKVDKDAGYTYLANIGHSIEQLRYQPPSVETFPTNEPVRDYASSVISNLAGNIPWLLSLPIEKQIGPQNWGFWLIHGQVGVVDNKAYIRAYNNPSAAAKGRGNCPFRVFFPPPSSECRCSTGDSASFTWHSKDSGFVIPPPSTLNLFQTARATPRFFGRHTRMKVDVTLTGTGGAGSQTNVGLFSVGIRTARVANVNLQPFHRVIRFHTQGNILSLPDTTFDVNIMQEMNRILGTGVYDIGGRDAIEAIQIQVITRSSAKWICFAEDGPGGTILPESCRFQESCSAGSLQALVNNLQIYEPAIVGDPVSNYT